MPMLSYIQTIICTVLQLQKFQVMSTCVVAYNLVVISSILTRVTTQPSTLLCFLTSRVSADNTTCQNRPWMACTSVWQFIRIKPICTYYTQYLIENLCSKLCVQEWQSDILFQDCGNNTHMNDHRVIILQDTQLLWFQTKALKFL